MIALALSAALLAPPQESWVPLEVSVRVDVDGRELCTMRAEQVPADRLLEEVARQLSSLPGHDPVVVEGFTPPLRAALVTVELVERPLAETLEWALGSVGLEHRRRPGVLSVAPREPHALTREDVRANAVLEFVRATRRFPDHRRAPHARLTQGRLEEDRGNLSAALGHYEAVQESYRDSPVVPVALWHRGLVLQRMGSWAEANLAFRTLANTDADAELEAGARLEMARCATKLGDPIRATHVLAALEESHPARTHRERVDRRLVGALAQMDAGRPMECLRELASILDGKLDEDQRHRVFALQARAFEGVGRPSEAAWAWQVYSDHVDGERRLTALENAARLSLEAGEEINVLFLEQLAGQAGGAERLRPWAADAEARLGLAHAPKTTTSSTHEVLARAEELIDAGDVARAARLLEPLFLERTTLPAGEAQELYPLWGRCVAAQRGLESAVRMLRTAREQFDELDQRRQVDLAAAALLEEHELYDRAVEAYEGRY